MDKHGHKKRIIRAERQKKKPGGLIKSPILDCASCPAKNNDRPSFRFGQQANSKISFQELTAEQRNNVIGTFIVMESMTWQAVNESGGHGKNAGGLGYGPVDKKSTKDSTWLLIENG